MRRIALALLLAACGGVRASDPPPRAPIAKAEPSPVAKAEPRIVPSGPYPVLFAMTDPSALRASFMKATPGWQATMHRSGRFMTSSPPAPVAALGTEGGARAFVEANAATLGIDPAVLAHPTVEGDQITFGATTWGRHAIPGLTVGPKGASGFFLGPLGAPPRELDDETLTRLIVGRKYDFQVTMRTTFHPCDPGPGGRGCPSGAPEPTSKRESILIERGQLRNIQRRVLGVTRPRDPSQWELRIAVTFSVSLDRGRCAEPYSGPNDPRVECTYQLEVDGKPAWGLVLDAVTGEPLFDRWLVLQVGSVTSSSP